MAKTEHIHLKLGKELKDAIKKAADKRNTNVTQLLFRGLIKEAPELKDAMLRDR
jgi:uncharacterized protein (DUF1778 family)